MNVCQTFCKKMNSHKQSRHCITSSLYLATPSPSLHLFLFACGILVSHSIDFGLTLPGIGVNQDSRVGIFAAPSEDIYALYLFNRKCFISYKPFMGDGGVWPGGRMRERCCLTQCKLETHRRDTNMLSSRSLLPSDWGMVLYTASKPGC